jgi:hypothetical protein
VHPVADRAAKTNIAISGCRKGNRDCEFPKPPSSKGNSRSKAARNRSSSREELDSTDGDEEEEDTTVLETIKDEPEQDDEDDEDDSMNSKQRPKPFLESPRNKSIHNVTRKLKYRQHVEATSAAKQKARSPSSDSSPTSTISGIQTPASSVPPSARETPSFQSRWANLKKDEQKYLEFHQEHITHYHYILHHDPNNFVHTDLVDLALTYKPLLYAVVGFAAYYHTLRQPDGKLSQCLDYYSRSLSLLLQSLQAGEQRTEATLLTMLQLATFEEHLGDWPNLIGHHRAAHEMLLQTYTVENVMDTERSRRILTWYGRFDVLAGLMAGNQMVLPREWYAQYERWYEEHIDADDVDLDGNLSYFCAANRLIGLDLATLLSKFPRGQISTEEFVAENEKLSHRMDVLRQRIQALNDDYYTVTDFPTRQPPGPNDIVDPYLPGGLFRDALFPLNYAWAGWYGTDLLRRYQTSLMLQQELPAGLDNLALELCRIFETIERWPHSPEGSTLGATAALGISALFLPKDQRHTMWLRRKLAAVEQNGYVYPMTFRSKMAEMWREPDVNHWWLPNDEGFSPLLRDIRAFIQERAEAYEQSKGDELRDDVRDMKAIFSKLNMDDSPKSSLSEGSASGVTSHSP